MSTSKKHYRVQLHLRTDDYQRVSRLASSFGVPTATFLRHFIAESSAFFADSQHAIDQLPNCPKGSKSVLSMLRKGGA